MTQKRSIKLMMSVGIPRNKARRWHRLGTVFRLTNEAVVDAAIHCGGGMAFGLWYADYTTPEKLRYEPPLIEIREEGTNNAL